MKKQLLLLALMLVSMQPFIQGQTMTAADSARFSAYWFHSKDMYDNLPDTKGKIVFLGNSITDGCEWAELLNNRNCINRGISGDVTEGILFRLSAITKLKPAKIFLLIGINDLSKDRSVEDITASYRQILERIRTETPGTKVYVQSVLPVNPVTNPKIRHTSKTPEILELNKNLKALAAEFGHQYVDLFSVMADENNYLPRECSFDGLHLSYAGYKLWADEIKKYIK